MNSPPISGSGLPPQEQININNFYIKTRIINGKVFEELKYNKSSDHETWTQTIIRFFSILTPTSYEYFNPNIESKFKDIIHRIGFHDEIAGACWQKLNDLGTQTLKSKQAQIPSSITNAPPTRLQPQTSAVKPPIVLSERELDDMTPENERVKGKGLTINESLEAIPSQRDAELEDNSSISEPTGKADQRIDSEEEVKAEDSLDFEPGRKQSPEDVL